MGGTLVPGGATFRTWAPAAHGVYVLGDFNSWMRDDNALLVRQGGGRWAGFFPGATDGMKYKFYVIGNAGEGHKRDPYARELTNEWPNPDCILRAATAYSWQDRTWRTPPFHELIVYQLHVGTFFGPNRETRPAPSAKGQGGSVEGRAQRFDQPAQSVHPNVAGNGGRIEANGPGLNGLAASAAVVVPANSLPVLSRTTSSARP